MRSFIVAAVLFCALMVAPAVAQQQQADGDEPETISAQDYSGQWILPQGPLRLEWNLEAEQYEFYVYEGESVRIGSRGTIEVDSRELTFTAEEITEDGESWEAVQVEDDARAARSFHATVEGDSLRLAPPETPIFFVEYYRPDAVPAGAGETAGSAENGVMQDAGAQN